MVYTGGERPANVFVETLGGMARKVGPGVFIRGDNNFVRVSVDQQNGSSNKGIRQSNYLLIPVIYLTLKKKDGLVKK
jgi:hypothetical protein